jgi:hypothetical protein
VALIVALSAGDEVPSSVTVTDADAAAAVDDADTDADTDAVADTCALCLSRHATTAAGVADALASASAALLLTWVFLPRMG